MKSAIICFILMASFTLAAFFAFSLVSRRVAIDEVKVADEVALNEKLGRKIVITPIKPHGYNSWHIVEVTYGSKMYVLLYNGQTTIKIDEIQLQATEIKIEL